MARWLCALTLLFVSAAAAADEKPRVAAQPLVVLEVPSESAALLSSTFLASVARQPVVMASSFAVDDFLSRRDAANCSGDEGCLLALCQATTADLAVTATVELKAGVWTVWGRAVSCSGLISREVVRGQVTVTHGPGALDRVSQKLDEVVGHITVGEALTAPAVAEGVAPGVLPEVAATTPTPADAPTRTAETLGGPAAKPAVDSRPGDGPRGVTAAVTPQRAWPAPVKLGLAGVAAAAGGAAVVLAVLNAQDTARLNAQAVDGRLPYASVPLAVAVDERAALATGLAAGAAVAGGSALVLHLLFPGEAPPVSVVPISGGGGLLLLEVHP